MWKYFVTLTNVYIFSYFTQMTQRVYISQASGETSQFPVMGSVTLQNVWRHEHCFTVSPRRRTVPSIFHFDVRKHFNASRGMHKACDYNQGVLRKKLASSRYHVCKKFFSSSWKFAEKIYTLVREGWELVTFKKVCNDLQIFILN